MNALVSRAAAVIGWIAYATGRLLRGIIPFAPRAVPWALVVALLLGLGAWRSIEGADAILASTPRPEPVALADVVDNRATGWVGTASFVRGPFLDSSSYGAPVQRWYYLLLDPADDSVAMIARSAERLEERRTRTIVARVTLDPSAVGAALAGLETDGLAVDPDRYLVELPDRRPPVLTGDSVATPAGGGIEAGEVVLRGSFDVARPAADGSGWEYLASDRGRAVVVRSPHPPEALPVDVWGVAATDRLRAEQASAVPELQSALDGRRLPERQLLAEGVTPPLPQASYLPAMLLAAFSAILVIGWLVGYPLFRRTPSPHRVSTWPMLPGDEISADLYGIDRRPSEAVVVDGAPGRLALLDPDEVERRSWQYALRDEVGAGPIAATGRPALALSSGEGPIMVRLDPGPEDLRVVTGTVVHAGGSRPAIRLRAGGLDLVAAFGSPVIRDRALAAMDPARAGAPRDGRPPAERVVRRADPVGDRIPGPLRAAAIMLIATGALIVAAGAVGLPGGSAPLVSGAQVAVGLAVAAVGRGVWLRRGWAQALGFTVAWVGAGIAAFLIVAAPQCGLWLAPNLAACQAAGPIGSVGALGAAVGLGYAALAIRGHAAAFVH